MTVVAPAPVEQEQLGLIQGKTPDSIEEYWVAQSLYKERIPFMYQYQLMGGKSRRGGIILDFLVFNPMGIPLPVHGKYWHMGELDGGDKTALIVIADFFNIGIENIPILWAGDSTSEQDVRTFIKKNFVR